MISASLSDHTGRLPWLRSIGCPVSAKYCDVGEVLALVGRLEDRVDDRPTRRRAERQNRDPCRDRHPPRAHRSAVASSRMPP